MDLRELGICRLPVGRSYLIVKQREAVADDLRRGNLLFLYSPFFNSSSKISTATLSTWINQILESGHY